MTMKQEGKATMARKTRFTVRKQTSGWNGTVKYYVWDTVSKGRVTVHAHLLRSTAQYEADELNISDMVKPYEEDQRPYAVRFAEARAAFEAQKSKPLIEVVS